MVYQTLVDRIVDLKLVHPHRHIHTQINDNGDDDTTTTTTTQQH